MQGFEITWQSLMVFSGLEVQRKKKCIRAFSSELFAIDKVLELVKQGIPFRDAITPWLKSTRALQET